MLPATIVWQEMGVAVIPESNDLMTGSYVMVDPAGRFFDNTAGAHVYSRPINQVGAGCRFAGGFSIDPARFRLRDGLCMIGEEQEGTMPELGITPQLPTSGQIIGALVARLGITHPVLQKRTTRRYFAADLEHLVKRNHQSRDHRCGSGGVDCHRIRRDSSV